MGSDRRIGRFTLRESIGRGAQATVWRAHDERLDRDVALKLLDAGADAVSVDGWLQEARAVSRLTHPNIVPVFEADQAGAQPYLVFELVPGATLAARLAREGALAPPEAVRLMQGVLDALAAAHAQGIVHRDLKPSNILLDAAGRARVMDFGIAARTGGQPAGGDGLIVGTPGYMSPEAARGEPPSPAMDLFAAGLVLAEMLSGQRLLRERDPMRALQRVQQEDLALPEGTGGDDALRAIVQRALARDPARRWPDAAAFRDALADWAKPAAQPAGAGGSHGTVGFLLHRIRQRSDFPALSDAMARIQRVSAADHAHLDRLTEEILTDVALTHKLLRLVNSAQFAADGGTVSTVSRAVALVGFAGIRNMAMSLLLLEHMADKAHAARLREEYLRALLAGQVADALCPRQRRSGCSHEEAFLAGLLCNLGRLLVEYYFPREADEIRQLAGARPGRVAPDPADVDTAAVRVLGVGLDALGVAVARAWGLPDGLLQGLKGGPPTGGDKGAERLRAMAIAANEAVAAVIEADAEHLPAKLDAVAARHARVLDLAGGELRQAVDTARHRLAEMVRALGMPVGGGSIAQRLLPEPAAAAARGRPDELEPHRLQATRTLPDVACDATVRLPARAPDDAAQMLSAGIQDITDTMAADDFILHEVLRMILETMMRALDLRRVIFCLRDAQGQALSGRFGLGERAKELAPRFRIALQLAPQAVPDLFTAICRKGADTLISDASAGAIAARLPPWYRQHVDAPTFLLLPIAQKGQPFALVYADKAQAASIEVADRELALLRTLRNQAVMAFRQSTA
jgi:HD-like signal output (HDOD) protein